MKKITKLTTEQEARLIEFRETWLRHGLCCEPADFETGDVIIRALYKRMNKPNPIIFHFSSPMMCELAVNFVFGMLAEKKPDQLRSQLYSQLHSQLGSQLGSQLDSQLGSQLYSQLGSQLHSQLYSQLYSQLGSQLHSQLDSQLGSQLGSQLYSQLDSQLRSQLHSQLGSQLYSQLGSQLDSQLYKLKPYFLNNRWASQHWCAWEAFYLFGHEIGVTYKAEEIALLQEWARLAQSISWWAPWDGICFVSDRPRVVKFDSEKRLHSETGKAVEYSDGWGVSAWHGTNVPDEWIADRSSLTPTAALKETNVERRRAACEIIGWGNILRELKAKTIDSDNDPEIGDLVEVKLPDLAGKAKFLRVRCGTGREFAIGIPPHINKALDAQAWCVGLEPKDFIQPEVRA